MSDSDSNDDNPIRYGTPLDPYEEDEIPTKRKYQQPADQYAVDAHGRRRFHGAFTGGFSAGFGNTVGSQEGWTPATFKSSRSEKAQTSSQRPEDFMDEEDRSEFGIAPKYMQTHSEFSGQKRSRPMYDDGPIPGEPVLDQLIRAVHETAAVKMLRSMGWKPGQGTGDRLTKADKKKARLQQKVYGCYMPPEIKDSIQSQSQESDEDSTDSEFEYDTLFAPDDYEPYILSRKNDRFGLGYKGLSRHSVLGNMKGEYGETSAKSHLVMKEKGKKVSIHGQAFGVGAFEDDDEDIYSSNDMSHYDFAIGGPPKEQTKKPKEKSNNVLSGFVRAALPLPPPPTHPAPALPRDYTPSPAGGRRTRFDATTAKPRDQGLGRHELTAEARGALLGEVPSKPPEKQESTNKEDLLAKITGRSVNFVTTNTENQDSNKIDSINKTSDPSIDSTSNRIEKIIDLSVPQSSTPDFISIKDSGKELTDVFKPFVGNPAKQKRYENYVNNKGSVLERDGEIDILSKWERERELMEFEQAAKLYKPLTGVMGDRFTHATAPDDATNPLTAVSKTNAGYGIATPDQMDAAARGVYGIMTRVTFPWRPESIVCKRFNIPDPGGHRPEPTKEDRPKISYSIFSYLEESVHDKDTFAKEQTKFSGSKSHIDKPKTDPKPAIVNQTDNTVKPTDQAGQSNEGHKRITAAELFLRESEKTKQQGEEVTKTIDKFDKMDLYKSIFLSDSEEDDEFDNDNAMKGTTIIEDFVDYPKNVERNTSPPRGIFANIDFDELNSWRRKDDKTNQETAKDKKDVSINKDSNPIEEMETDQVYGPKIPENIQERLDSMPDPNVESKESNDVHEIGSSSSDSWVDAKEIKDKKKKKKSKHKKHKSKHKKSKHKKKDR